MSARAPAPRQNRTVGWTTLLIAALACLAQTNATLAAHLALDRSALAGLEGWRAWTGHLAHFSGAHLAWNLIPLLSVGLWAERLAPTRTRAFYLLAPPLISAVVLLDACLQEYRGLSGIVMGLVGLVALHQLRHDRSRARRIWPVVLMLIAVKLAWELWKGTAAFA
ncbi:MAG TPA: rhombosortase [Opitutaceae bacterium]|nr:rhombosortase [Opitutaceae bacterium]